MLLRLGVGRPGMCDSGRVSMLVYVLQHKTPQAFVRRACLCLCCGQKAANLPLPPPLGTVAAVRSF